MLQQQQEAYRIAGAEETVEPKKRKAGDEQHVSARISAARADAEYG